MTISYSYPAPFHFFRSPWTRVKDGLCVPPFRCAGDELRKRHCCELRPLDEYGRRAGTHALRKLTHLIAMIVNLLKSEAAFASSVSR